MRKVTLVLSWLIGSQLGACKSRQESTSALRADDTPDYESPIQVEDIGGEYRAGDEVELALNPNRTLDQVTLEYSGKYSLIERDAWGKPLLNDEGQPRYRDGMYAYGYIVADDGSEREVARKKFIDLNETDNWHDLAGQSGTKLVIRFRHSEAYQHAHDVVAARRIVRFTRATIRYQDPPGQLHEDITYNNDYDDSLSSDAIRVGPDNSHSIFVAKQRRIYRVDVRWGDEKPRVNGVYVPGQAHGRLTINGIPQGDWRNVAAIETQTWVPVTVEDNEHPTTKVTVQFRYDVGRIHGMRYYYRQ